MLTELEKQEVHREIHLSKKIKSPFCVEFIDSFETPEKIYLVFELLAGGDVFNRVYSSYLGCFRFVSRTVVRYNPE
jgi:serine/threonine protein kinase